MLVAKVWTVKDILDWIEQFLAEKNCENPRLSAQWLVGNVTGLSRVELYAQYDRPLTMEERDTLRSYVVRRANGEPLQYITGEVSFRYITLKTAPGVLIARPETEVLVSVGIDALKKMDNEKKKAFESSKLEVLKFLAEHRESDGSIAENIYKEACFQYGIFCSTTKLEEEYSATACIPWQDVLERIMSLDYVAKSQKVADICTGSACIAASIAYELPNTLVKATDIAPEALALAQKNIEHLSLENRIEVLYSDLADVLLSQEKESYDLIISNPPYIPSSVLEEMPKEVVEFEPHLALDGGKDGLDIFRRLAPEAYELLKPGGVFAVELHEVGMENAQAIALNTGFSQAQIIKDLAGKPRILSCLK